MALTKAIILGGIGGIAVPFMVGGSTSPYVSLLAAMTIPGPNGTVLMWSWPVFCFVTGVAWALFRMSQE